MNGKKKDVIVESVSVEDDLSVTASSSPMSQNTCIENTLTVERCFEERTLDSISSFQKTDSETFDMLSSELLLSSSSCVLTPRNSSVRYDPILRPIQGLFSPLENPFKQSTFSLSSNSQNEGNNHLSRIEEMSTYTANSNHPTIHYNQIDSCTIRSTSKTYNRWKYHKTSKREATVQVSVKSNRNRFNLNVNHTFNVNWFRRYLCCNTTAKQSRNQSTTQKISKSNGIHGNDWIFQTNKVVPL